MTPVLAALNAFEHVPQMCWRWLLGLDARLVRWPLLRDLRTVWGAKGVSLPVQQISLVYVFTWAMKLLEVWVWPINRARNLQAQPNIKLNDSRHKAKSYS